MVGFALLLLLLFAAPIGEAVEEDVEEGAVAEPFVQLCLESQGSDEHLLLLWDHAQTDAVKARTLTPGRGC